MILVSSDAWQFEKLARPVSPTLIVEQCSFEVTLGILLCWVIPAVLRVYTRDEKSVSARNEKFVKSNEIYAYTAKFGSVSRPI